MATTFFFFLSLLIATTKTQAAAAAAADGYSKFKKLMAIATLFLFKITF